MAIKRTVHAPVVSIICITYNQEKFIGQTLESFLAQKTKFLIEVLIHDDASTDGTAKIIASYARQYPDIIKPKYEKENQFSAGNNRFINDMFNQARGKYIAICEGDDFWTDPEKLQRQVDLLESHADYSMCFHPVRVFFEDGSQEDTVYPESHRASEFTTTNLLRRNFIQSNSIMYRAIPGIQLPFGVMPLDWYTHLYYAQFGKIGFIDEVMSAYRRHAGGIWWEATQKGREEFWKKHGAGHMALYSELLKMYGGKPGNRLIIDKNIEETVNILGSIDHSDNTNLIGEFVEKLPELSGPLLLSLSRVTYKNHKQLEKLEEDLREVLYNLKRLELEKEKIINSRAYKVGTKLASVSHIVRGMKS